MRLNSKAYTMISTFLTLISLQLPIILSLRSSVFIHYSVDSDDINCMPSMCEAVVIPAWSSGANRHIVRRVC